MTNYNLYEELKKIGFDETTDQFGRETLVKGMGKFVHKNMAWAGEADYFDVFSIEAHFNADKTVVQVAYYNGFKTPFKTKTYMSNRRTFNAMAETAKNHSFAEMFPTGC